MLLGLAMVLVSAQIGHLDGMYNGARERSMPRRPDATGSVSILLMKGAAAEFTWFRHQFTHRLNQGLIFGPRNGTYTTVYKRQ